MVWVEPCPGGHTCQSSEQNVRTTFIERPYIFCAVERHLKLEIAPTPFGALQWEFMKLWRLGVDKNTHHHSSSA